MNFNDFWLIMSERMITVTAKWIVENHGGRPDHACVECVEWSEILIDGFRCYYHRAKAALENTEHERDAQAKPNPLTPACIKCGGDLYRDWGDEEMQSWYECKECHFSCTSDFDRETGETNNL
jgi:hypothetical protein